MKHAAWAHRALAIGTALILAGCSRRDMPSPTLMPLPTLPAIRATPTISVTTLPTFVPTTPTVTLVADDVPPPDAALVNDILFRESISGCALPCWERLRVGVSGAGDIQRVMDRTFGFRGNVDFFATPPNIAAPLIPEIDGLRAVGHQWSVNGGVSVLRMLFMVDEGGVLQGIEFAMQRIGPYEPYTVREIVRHLGKPDHVALRIGESANTLGGSDTLVRVAMLYREGLAFTTIVLLDPPVAGQTTLRACLDQRPNAARIHIVPPLDDFTGTGAYLLQAHWVFGPMQVSQLQSVEDVLGMDAGAFTELALSVSPCFETDIS